MKMGIHQHTLAKSLMAADRVILFEDRSLKLSLTDIQQQLGDMATIKHNIDEIIELVCQESAAGDEVLIMSNGGFGGIHQRLLSALAAR
jgi:UDP-N-acetylmuramate: L-alanyl-gamma-D-glutamyl-meso-diaminopimelate ligase